MATVLLSAAGSAIGGSIGGSVLGIGAAALGQAVGATVGGLVDNAILGGGGKSVNIGRRESIRLTTASEGAPITRIIGRMRSSGQLIWSTRFKENVLRSSQGSKATTTTVKTYSYTISFAIGICEGVIERIGRVWADGAIYDISELNYRLYRGEHDQSPDPKIEAVEGTGNAPAYRGLAYIVFEDFPVGQFGNRVPVLNFEVFRSPNVAPELATAQGFGTPVRSMIQAVCLSPGTGEFALETRPVRHNSTGPAGRYVNINNSAGIPDLVASLDQLEGDLPECSSVSLVVSWFGDDLRCDRCTVRPRIEEAGRTSWPYSWSVSGSNVFNAPLISRDEESRPNFGGTPSDASVINAIVELGQRGKKVMFYPFLLMDIPDGNSLDDPYNGAEDQPAFPWRGRITLSIAPGSSGTPDQTAAAAAEVAAFFGTAVASDFAVTGKTVAYSGPAEWTLRRFVLHCAALCKAAGGVDAFCIGSELPGLTTIRSSRTVFPAVSALRSLAAEVRLILPDAKIGYAADWSEYFGFHPQDGTGDILFHLDDLWADEMIDFIGIDNYIPLSDWRSGDTHLDSQAGSKSIYDVDYLQSNIEGGEGYDWFYIDKSSRDSQTRSPIVDLAYGEDWIWRFKDFRSWWQYPHRNRVGGNRAAEPTAWIPQSKPIWFTEVGCPAVDLGSNQPNAFVDPFSSESQFPYFSRGARDDLIQSRFLQAMIGYWQDPANNPTSNVYPGRMIEDGKIFAWTWDARPWPDFPMRESLWKDGPNHSVGHWLQGRIGSSALAEAVAEITQSSVPDRLDLSRLNGSLDGLIVDGFDSPREVLQGLIVTHDLKVRQSGAALQFWQQVPSAVREVDRGLIVSGSGEAASSLVYEVDPGGDLARSVQLSFTRGDIDFRTGTAEASLQGERGTRVDRFSVPVSLSGARAREISANIAVEAREGGLRAQLELPLSTLDLEVGDEIALPVGDGMRRFRIERVREGLSRRIEASAVSAASAVVRLAEERGIEPPIVSPPAPVEARFLDLPIANGTTEDAAPWIAATADPWPGEVIVWRSTSDSTYNEAIRVRSRAVIGATTAVLPAGVASRWQKGPGVTVKLTAGVLESVDAVAVLNGANRAALLWPDGIWEIIQFRAATLVGPQEYRLRDLLRGQRNTMRDGQVLPAAAPFVLLDDAVERLPFSPELRGLERHYRVGPAAVGVDHFSTQHSLEAFDIIGLRPFSPVHLRARLNRLTGDIQVTWIRTTRTGGDSWQGLDVPLGETAERYLVEIVDGGSRLRSLVVEGPTFLYPLSDQLSDGSTASSRVRVAQISDSYGYGRTAEVRLHE